MSSLTNTRALTHASCDLMLCSQWPFFPNLKLPFKTRDFTSISSFRRPQNILTLFLRKTGTAPSSRSSRNPPEEKTINKYSNIIETLLFHSLKFDAFMWTWESFTSKKWMIDTTTVEKHFLFGVFQIKLNQFLSTSCCFSDAMIWSVASAHKLRRPSKAWTFVRAIWSPDWIMHRERDKVRWTHETANRRQSWTCWTAAVHSKITDRKMRGLKTLRWFEGSIWLW